MEARNLQYWTYRDYCNLNDDKRNEIINGMISQQGMPASSVSHQHVLGELHFQIKRHLQNKPCRVYIAPLDVVLLDSNQEEDSADNIVQPDLIVLCDPSKVKNGRSCVGAPDLVVEILSPSSRRRDMIIKSALYAKYGVQEYWIVDPDDMSITVLQLKGSAYVIAFEVTEDIPFNSSVLPGLELEFNQIFEII